MASAGLSWAARVTAALKSAAAPVPSVAALRPAGPPSPADRLHRHALESVFAFLGLRQLAIALRVSRSWLAAVQSMRRLELQVEWATAAPVGQMAHSAMGRHIGRLQCDDLDADALALLAARLAHLRQLTCFLGLPDADQPEAGQPIRFPASLRLLDIHFEHLTDVQINAVIAAIGRLPLLEELGIVMDALDRRMSFAPLAGLPLLRCLKVTSNEPQAEFGDAQVDQLRALPRLEKISILPSTPVLRRLLRRPHDLQWRQLPLPYPLDDEAAALLPQLPSLTAIYRSTSCSRFDWLRGLPNLTGIGLAVHSPMGAAGYAESLVAALRCCIGVEILRLFGFAELTAAHLADLLPRLPRLRDLTLHSLLIDSLAFLAQPPLTSQLVILDLSHCRQLPLAGLRHVHSLRGLKELWLNCSFSTPLDAESQSLLTPPSILLPQLEKFTYKAPWGYTV
jgi:hypothetical protein